MQRFQDAVLSVSGRPVSGASVRVRNRSGTTATIYSDNGTTLAANPLTTDSTGEFAFYAPNGRYDIEVSGAGLTTETRADVVLFDPADAAILNVRDYGAKGDGVTDDMLAIQAAIDAAHAAGGGEVIIPKPPAYYRTALALQAKSGVTVRVSDNATRIVCTGDGPGSRWPLYGCWMFGGFTGANHARASAFAINNVAAGDATVTMTAAPEAANFVVGDVVCIETTTTFAVGSDNVPTWLQLNVVTGVNVSTGVVTLRHPVDDTRSNVRLRNLRTSLTTLNADGTDSGRPLRGIRDFSILGGTWENALSEGPFMGDGGLIDCVIKPYKVIAATGAPYGNLFANCVISQDVFIGRLAAVELAFGSHGNTVLCGAANMTPSALAVDRVVGLNEAARDNSINVTAINIGSSAFVNVLQIVNALRNTVEIRSITGKEVSAATVILNRISYAGTNVSTTDNDVIVGASRVSNQLRYVQTGSNVSRNRVSGRFFGVVSADAASVIGSSNVIDAWFENGTLAVPGASANRFVGNLGADRSAGTDYALSFANVYDQESDTYRTLRALSLRKTPNTYTSASPLNQTVTFPAGTFVSGDTIAFKLRGVAGGASGSKTISVSFAGTTIYTVTIATTGSIEVEGIVILEGSSVAVGHVTGIVGGTPSVTDTGITGLNFATTAYNLVFAATVASAGDTFALRYLAAKPIRTMTDSAVLVG